VARQNVVRIVGLEQAERDLKLFATRAIPFAARKALNESAFQGRLLWQRKMRGEFTLRNRWTERSALVDRANGLLVSAMESELGSALEYLEKQEEGFTESSSGKHGLPIPTGYAAGQDGANPRTRLVARRRWQSAIQLAPRPGGVSRQARNYGAIAAAAKSGTRFVFLELGGRRMGIFERKGSLRGGTLRMVWDMSRGSVRVDANQTLDPAIDELRPKLPSIHERAVIEQLKRNKVFGY